ncbi:MAG: 3-deoxy-7-phosphoheptulonate synthase [Tissierellia bacterium]|nr:3-deoxy-7-phosphoheptulonate synthase [Tissierellia bacterium]
MIIIAGSCSMESEEQALKLANQLKKRNIDYVRAAIFKPRTDPNTFQGLGYVALPALKKIREMGLKTVTEVVDPRQIDPVYDHVDVYQVGTRNMHNFSLLKELGKVDKPVILKRGLCAYMDEWLKAAEYIEKGGNGQVILCERGIRSFDVITRNVLDIGAIIYLKKKTGYQVLVDPSHSMGHREFVVDAAKAGLAAGADGVMVEVHEEPDRALTDSKQTIDLPTLDTLLDEVEWEKVPHDHI